MTALLATASAATVAAESPQRVHELLAANSLALEPILARYLQLTTATPVRDIGVLDDGVYDRLPVYVSHPPAALQPLEVSLSSASQRLLQDIPTYFAGLSIDASTASGIRTRLAGHIPRSAMQSGVTIRFRYRATDGKEEPASEGSEAQGELALNPDDIAGVQALEVRFLPPGLLGRHKVSATAWRHASDKGVNQSLLPSLSLGGDAEDQFRHGDARDPALRAAVSQVEAGLALDGLAAIDRIRRELLPGDLEPNALHEALAMAAVEAGLWQLAAQELRILEDRQVAPDVTGRLRLRLARHQLRNGLLQPAIENLEQMDIAHEKAAPLKLEWQHLMSRTLLHQGGSTAGMAQLADQEGLFHEAHRNLQQPIEARRLYAFIRYNRAVGLLRDGDLDAGRSWLDIAGRVSADEPQTRALRDKANITLGWSLIRDKHGLAALEVLHRVSLDGPFSDKAMLGAGWAIFSAADEEARKPLRRVTAEELGVSQSDQQLPDFVTETLVKRKLMDPQLYGPQSLRRRFGAAESPATPEEAAQRALNYWVPLKTRNPRSAPIQEAGLAIALAYRVLGDGQQAAAQYLASRHSLEGMLKEMEAADRQLDNRTWLEGHLIAITEAGRQSGTRSDDLRWFITQAVLQDRGLLLVDQYRRIERLLRRIQPLGDSALLEQISTLHEAVYRQIHSRLRQELQVQRQQTQKYLAAAYAGYLDMTANQPENQDVEPKFPQPLPEVQSTDH